MKNKILGIIALIVVGASTLYISNNMTEEVDPEVTSQRDSFGNDYNIDNEYFVFSSQSEIETMIDNEESFIVFIGRKTWIYCRRTVPELHKAVGNSPYDTVYYIDKLDSNNSTYVRSQNVVSDPTIIFFSNGKEFERSVGFKSQNYFETLLYEMSKST